MHQNPAATILVACPEVVENAQDNTQLEECVRGTPGRQNARVLKVRKLVDESGKIKGYEVDIR